ncbi:MAG: hypothetical protein ABI706_13220 [Ilumatobacteraceae bacterium]
MAASKGADLAKRLADRLDGAQPRGRALTEPEPTRLEPVAATAGRASPGHPSQGRGERPGRASNGGRLRGHLVPHALHSDARRLKLSQQARRGRRVTWDDVATEAVELLLSQRDEVARQLTDVRRMAEQATSGPRLVQATIAGDLDAAFGELRLDLSDEIGRDVPYEQLWAAALLMWLRAHR